MKKIKYYIVAVIMLGFCYWWFGYREMSLVEYYVTANYYEKLKKEDNEKIDKVGRIFFVASYCGHKSKFLDTLRSIICKDVAKFKLQRHFIQIYKLPFFIGRNSHDNHYFSEDSESMTTTWHSSDSNEILLNINHRKEVIPLDCDEWNEGSR